MVRRLFSWLKWSQFFLGPLGSMDFIFFLFQVWHLVFSNFLTHDIEEAKPPQKEHVPSSAQKKTAKRKKNTNHFPKQKKKLTNNEHYMIADLSCFEPPEFWGPLFWVEELMELRREAAVEVVWGVAQLVVGGARFLWWMKHNMNIYETPGFFIFFPQKPSGLVRKDVVWKFGWGKKISRIFPAMEDFPACFSCAGFCRFLFATF